MSDIEQAVAESLYPVLFDPDWPAVTDFTEDAKTVLAALSERGYEVVSKAVVLTCPECGKEQAVVTRYRAVEHHPDGSHTLHPRGIR